jgi:cytochrome bd ubiquinol oxidase subunit II
MQVNTLDLSRWQFGITTVYHFIFVPLTIGISILVAAMQTAWVVLPSTTSPAFSLTVSNASSSHYTLMVMTWVALAFTPVVLAYQGWTYWVFRQRLSRSDFARSGTAATGPGAPGTRDRPGPGRAQPVPGQL